LAAVTGVAGVAAACAAPAQAPTQAPAATAAPTQPPAATRAPAPTNTAIPTVAKEKVLNLADNLSLSSFNPLQQSNGMEFLAFNIFMSQLLYPDGETQSYVPGLAESWTQSADGSSVTFNLQPKAMWHDGTPVTATDVEYTFRMGLLNATKSSKVGAFQMIKGGADYSDGKTDKVAGLTIVDDKTLKVDFEFPNILFFNEIGARAQILPEHILGSIPPEELPKSEFATVKPLGCGPFKFVKYVEGQYIEFEADPNHWFGRPKIDRVVLNLIKNLDTMEAALSRGEVHWANTDGTSFPTATFKKFAGDPNFKVVATGNGAVLPYCFNHAVEDLKDKRLHQAFMYAFDRPKLVQSFLGGVGTTPPSWMDHKWYQKPEWQQMYPYDPAKAKALLSEINWNPDREITVHILPIASEDDRAILAAQQSMLADVGIKVKYQEEDGAALVQRFYYDKDYEIVYVTCSIFPDPDGFLQWHMVTSGKNTFNYGNADLDKKIDAGRRATKREDRIAIYQDLAAQMLEDQPLPVAYRQNVLYMWNKKFVVPGMETMPALQPDFKDMGPGRYLLNSLDNMLLNPHLWDLTA